jgi:hypothetical protein
VGLGSKREGRRSGRRTLEVLALCLGSGLEDVAGSVVVQPSDVYLSRCDRGMDFSSVVSWPAKVYVFLIWTWSSTSTAAGFGAGAGVSVVVACSGDLSGSAGGTGFSGAAVICAHSASTSTVAPSVLASGFFSTCSTRLCARVLISPPSPSESSTCSSSSPFLPFFDFFDFFFRAACIVTSSPESSSSSIGALRLLRDVVVAGAVSSSDEVAASSSGGASSGLKSSSCDSSYFSVSSAM